MLRRSFLILTLFLFPTFAPAQEKLPRVLLLGDSISLGYTPVVIKLLKEKAAVSRPNANCQHSAFGLANINNWLGKEKWDVIHFNWGIWDTHMLTASGALVKDDAKGELHIRHTPEKYRENMTKLVGIMEKTGAKLIFATTTPIMSRKGDRFEDIKKLNAVAVEVMKEHKVAVNDLYELSLPKAKEWQSGDQVHFNAVGSQKLAEQVSASILEALGKK